MTQFNPDPRIRDPRRMPIPPEQGTRDHLEWDPIYPPEPPTTGRRANRGALWVALGLVILATIVGLLNLHHITAFLESMFHIGPEWDDGEQVKGLIAFGVVLVSILAAMKIALHSRGEA